MAGFFSLGGGSNSNNNNNRNHHQQDPNNPNHEINPDTLFLYSSSNPNRNQDNSSTTTYPYNKGTFELWQNPPPPPPPDQRHQQHPLMFQDLYSLAVGSSYRGGGGGGGINILDDQSRSSGEGGLMMMGSSTSSGGGTISCQDCGNQAKKDCVHRRCRSCCKSRGFECPTHVKSTWVPAAKRRERQQQIAGGGAALPQQQNQQQQQDQDQDQVQLKMKMNTNTSTSTRHHQYHYPKRVRDHNTCSSSLLPTTTSNPSGLELANLPAEVNSLAVFRCVRVSSIDNTEDQFAYQTSVNIGGHTFKGILYDQGLEAHYLEGDTSSAVSGNINPQLNLTTTSSPGTTTASVFLDNYQSAPGHNNPFMAGTQFFHQPPRS